MSVKRILFAGYAPVHFICFLPVYRRLVKDPAVEIWLSGGFQSGPKEARTYSLDGFYDPFPVNRDRVIPLDRAKQEDFDVLVGSSLSASFFPRSVGRSVQIFHGVSFKNLAIREKALKFDILCLPGRYHAETYLRKGLVRPDGSKVLITGFAKADPMVSGTLDRDALLRRLEVDPSRPTILFAPTGEKDNALESKGEKIIRLIAGHGAWNLLIKPHDHAKNEIDWFKRLAPFEKGNVRLVREPDVVPYLHAADLLVTDASSVAVEYTLMDRPVIFIDVPKLFKRVAKRATALDLETYGRRFGTIVGRSSQVVAAIEDALANPDREREIRHKMVKHIFHRPGDAAERVTGVVRYAAGLEKGLPDGVETVTAEGIGVSA